MGRDATKAAGNPWYEARLNAAKWNPKLSSREGAAEAIGSSIDVLNRVENGLHKCMPVDLAVLLADLYNAPHLVNYYCMSECPIGCRRPISDEVVEIDRVTVKLLKNLRVSQLDQIKEKLIDIAEDGVISEDEKPELREVMEYLDELAKVLSELKILSERTLNGR